MKAGCEKRFKQGDIVYWCHQVGHKYTIGWGMVDEQFSDAVCIDYLHMKESRIVNGIPFNEFENETRYRKLPKGWTYNTELFTLTYDIPKELSSGVLKLDNSEYLIELYNKGVLVKDSEISLENIDADITRDGYRLVKKYPHQSDHASRISVRPDKLYFTYNEAKEEVAKNIAEFTRQANLSEYDWSVEQIDKSLNWWAAQYNINDKVKKAHRDWLLSMENVENIETRVFGDIQWKYWKNKKWNNIELY